MRKIMQLSFLGAAGTVTGSKYLFELNHKKILIYCQEYLQKVDLLS